MTEISTLTNYSNTENVLKDIFSGSANSTAKLSPVDDAACDMANQRLVDQLFIKLIFFLLYFIIFCLGFFGNILGKDQKVFAVIVTFFKSNLI